MDLREGTKVKLHKLYHITTYENATIVAVFINNPRLCYWSDEKVLRQTAASILNFPGVPINFRLPDYENT